jgi:hypothetical protein
MYITGMYMNQHTENKLIYNHAIQLIRYPHNWTQGACARDKDENPTTPECRDGVKWCSLGALWQAYYVFGISHEKSMNHPLVELFFKKLNEGTKDTGRSNSLSIFNDTSTHSQVLEFWLELGREHGFDK